MQTEHDTEPEYVKIRLEAENGYLNPPMQLSQNDRSFFLKIWMVLPVFFSF